MAQGRGGAGKTMVAIGLALLLLLMFLYSIDAETTYVGGSGGWTLGFADFHDGSNVWSLCIGDVLGELLLCLANDALVVVADFKYDKSKHNVVVVANAKDFFSCKPPLGAKTYNSGHETFSIKEGNNIFICGVPGH